MHTKYNKKYARELLTDAVTNSFSVAGVLRYLEIPWSGGTHAHISRRIKQFGIDTSHFKRVAPNKGKPCTWRLTPDQSGSYARRARHGRSHACCAVHYVRSGYGMSVGHVE